MKISVFSTSVGPFDGGRLAIAPIASL